MGFAHLLRARGCEVTVTNPSPTPERYHFLFHDLPGVDRSDAAVKELRQSDLIVVLDISDLGRLGMLGGTGSGTRRAGRLYRSSREPGTASSRAALRESRGFRHR